MTIEQHLDAGALAELRKLMGNDFGVLVETFVTDSDQRIVAIEAALRVADAEELRRSAHSFKGSASNMGAWQLAEWCRQIEAYGREGALGNAGSAVAALRTEYDQVRALMVALA